MGGLALIGAGVALLLLAALLSLRRRRLMREAVSMPGSVAPLASGDLARPPSSLVPGLVGTLGVVSLGVGVALYLSAPPPVMDRVISVPTEPSTVPRAIPTGDPGAYTLAVQDRQGTRTVSSACVGIQVRDGGTVVDVELSFEDKTLTFRVQGYEGPLAYTAGEELDVGGSFFRGGPEDIVGVVAFDETERAGVVNLAKGARSVTGVWICAG